MPKEDTKVLLDRAKKELIRRAVEKPSQPTIVDGAPPPAPASAPMPKELKEPPELDSGPFNAREADTKVLGRRRAQVASPSSVDSVFPGALAGLTPSVMATAQKVPLFRVLVMIATTGAAVSGVIAAGATAAVSIITALRPASNAELKQKLDAIETRVNGDFGMKLETETRQKKDEELKTELDAVKSDLKKLDESIPLKLRVKVNKK